MLRWTDILRFAEQGNPAPERRVEKDAAEWRAQLTPEQYHVTREKGTERAFSSEMCSLFEPGRYACVCCDTPLFDAQEKFESGTGWPSFTQPVKENAIAYHADISHGMQRVEVVCNTCDAHLGHVFPDGPPPSGLRYCINALALHKATEADATGADATGADATGADATGADATGADTTGSQALATFGGGCFWCTEAIFQQLAGVDKVVSGYSGGNTPDPSYQAVCSGATGHAEVVQVSFDPRVISYADLLRIHLGTHDPTTPNRQGADKGTQYRSIILPHNQEQAAIAKAVIEEMAAAYEAPIVTEIKPFEHFYPAEAYHQDYYLSNPEQPYCAAVISPKLQHARQLFKGKLREPAA